MDGNGVWVQYDEHGTKTERATYKGCKKDGLSTLWGSNGQKEEETTWKDDVEVSRKFYYDNGQKLREITYKDGKLWTAVGWKLNGERDDTDVADGYGVWVEYNEADGAETERVNYRNGEEVVEESYSYEKPPPQPLDDKDAMCLDYNLTIREIFSQVEGVSQHGLDELFDDEIRQGKKSLASEIVRVGIATKEDILSLVGEHLGCEVQIGEVEEIEPEVLALIQPDVARQYAIVPLYLSEGGIHLLAADPFNTKIIDDLTYSLKMEPFLIVCDSEKVDRLIEKYYGKTM